jgi:hypothetical protein
MVKETDDSDLVGYTVLMKVAVQIMRTSLIVDEGKKII